MSTLVYVLRGDHDFHLTLMDLIASSSRDSDQRRFDFSLFVQQFRSHQSAEERIFDELQTKYGYCHWREPVALNRKEHVEMDEVLAALIGMPPHAAQWLPTFRELKHIIERHETGEERESLHLINETLSEAENIELGRRFRSIKQASLPTPATCHQAITFPSMSTPHVGV